MTTETHHRHRDVPAWVFVLVIILCLLGGGAFVYYWLKGASPLGTQITLKPGVERGGGGGGGGEGRRGGGGGQQRPEPQIELQRQTDAVRQYRVRTGRFTWQVTDNKQGTDAFELRYRQLGEGEPDELRRMALRLTTDNSTARHIKATPEQLEQLRGIGYNQAGVTAAISPEDTATLTSVWNEGDFWNQPPNGPGADKVLTMFEQVARSSIPRTRDKLAADAERVKQILSAEQLTLFRSMGRPATPPPAAPPAQPIPEPGPATNGPPPPAAS